MPGHCFLCCYLEDTATAAGILGVSPSRVLQMCYEGKLQARRENRRWLIKKRSLEEHKKR
ncbi:MAG: helix-turn-helix domain-containing protein [Syntrophothermus sp.]|nr:helix-turn-helix domain-containing protein [Syntrophothermus sp.]